MCGVVRGRNPDQHWPNGTTRALLHAGGLRHPVFLAPLQALSSTNYFIGRFPRNVKYSNSGYTSSIQPY